MKSSQIKHFVYYLYKSDGALAYVGRSMYPAERKQRAEARYAQKFTMRVSAPFFDLDTACEEERHAIRTLRPFFNKRVASARNVIGRTQSWEERRKKSLALKNIAKTSLHRKKMRSVMSTPEYKEKQRQAHLGHNNYWYGKHLSSAQCASRRGSGNGMYGKKHSKRSKRLMSEAHRGVLKSKEHKASISQSAYTRWDLYHMLNSGFGHQWRLQNLDDSTRILI